MRLSVVCSALLALVGVVSVAAKVPTYDTLVSDTLKLDNDTKQLNKLVIGTDGTDLSVFIMITKGAQQVNKDFINTAAHFTALPTNLTSDQAQSLITTIKKTEDRIKLMCDNFNANRAGYNVAGVTTFVYADVRNLAISISNFGLAFISRVPQDTVRSAKGLRKRLDANILQCTTGYLKYII